MTDQNKLEHVKTPLIQRIPPPYQVLPLLIGFLAAILAVQFLNTLPIFQSILASFTSAFLLMFGLIFGMRRYFSRQIVATDLPLSTVRWDFYGSLALISFVIIGTFAVSPFSMWPLYLIVPPFLWLLLRYNIRGAIYGSLTMALVVVISILIFQTIIDRPVELQLLLLSLTVVGLFLGHFVNQYQQLLSQFKELEQIKQEWEATVDTLPELVCLLDETGHVVRANRTVGGWASKSVVDIQGMTIHDLLHPHCFNENCYLERFYAEAWEQFKLGVPSELDAQDKLLGRDLQLQLLPLINFSWPETDRRGKALFVVRDMTDWQLTEQALQRSEDLLERVIASISDHIYVTDVTETGLYVNSYLSPHVVTLTGYPYEYFAEDWNFWPSTVIHPEDRPLAQSQAQRLAQGEASEVEYRLIRADGEIIWVRDSGRVERRRGVTTIYGVVSDITDRKIFEARWRKYEFIANASREFMTLINRDLVYEAVNEAYCQAHQLDRDEVVGQLVNEVWGDKRYEKKIRMHLEECFAGNEVRYQEWFGFATLGQRYFDVAYYPYRDAQGIVTHAVVISRDITQSKLVEVTLNDTVRKLEQAYRQTSTYAEELQQEVSEREAAEEALRYSEALTRSVVNNVVDGIITTDADFVIESLNPAAEEIFGYAAGDVLHQSIDLLIPGQSMLMATNENHKATRSMRSRDIYGIRQDKTNFPMDLAVSAFELGEKKMYIGIVRDITDQKNLEEQFRQAQKMEAIGRLAGGVAHDFNNILTVISGYSELLLRQYPDPNDPARGDVELIKSASSRAAELTRQLLAFSRQQTLRPQLISLNNLVLNLERMLHRLLTPEIKLTTDLAPELASILADPGQVDQVLMNLAVNARDAMPGGGELRVKTEDVTLDRPYHRSHFTVPAGDYVRLAVSDTGTGMDAETLRRVFDPFFTTKAPGKGTGLGLSTVYGIIRQSNGYIVIDSEINVGTTIYIYFPQAEAYTRTNHFVPETMPTDNLRGDETILLVEDESTVRMIARRFLQKQGYTVLEASHPEAALKLCKERHDEIDLLLTDIIMPYMNGRELADQLLGHYPELKVLYISGYADDALSEYDLISRETILLEKPFSSEELARKVRETLDYSEN